MNMNNIRLDDKFNAMALATIVAIVVSIGSALVSVAQDASTIDTAQAATTSYTLASTGVIAAR